MIYNIVDKRKNAFARTCHVVFDTQATDNEYQTVVEHVSEKGARPSIVMSNISVGHALELAQKIEWSCTLFLYDVEDFM